MKRLFKILNCVDLWSICLCQWLCQPWHHMTLFCLIFETKSFKDIFIKNGINIIVIVVIAVTVIVIKNNDNIHLLQSSHSIIYSEPHLGAIMNNSRRKLGIACKHFSTHIGTFQHRLTLFNTHLDKPATSSSRYLSN